MDFFFRTQLHTGQSDHAVFFGHFHGRSAVTAGVVIGDSNHIQSFDSGHTGNIGRSHVIISAGRQAGMDVQVIGKPHHGFSC